MPRPVSWTPRISEIRRSVANSVRSHYETSELQRLFQLQPRAARHLLDLLPTVAGAGRSLLVKREDLEKFLDQAQATEDLTALCLEQRASKGATSRGKVRNLVRRDFEPISAASLAPWISRGELHPRHFERVEELADFAWRLVSALADDTEAFIQLYEPEVSVRKPAMDFDWDAPLPPAPPVSPCVICGREDRMMYFCERCKGCICMVRDCVPQHTERCSQKKAGNMRATPEKAKAAEQA